MEQILKFDFETLDTIFIGDAPFLISISDGLQEELRLVIAAAETGSVAGVFQSFMNLTKPPDKHSMKYWPIPAQSRLTRSAFTRYASTNTFSTKSGMNLSVPMILMK